MPLPTDNPDTAAPRAARAGSKPSGTTPHPRHARHDKLALLHDVSRQLTSILDRRCLLERVAGEVKRLIDYQLFGVMLWDEERQVLESAVSVTHDGCSLARREMALGEGLCGTAAQLGRPVRVADVTRDPRYFACCDSRVRSEMVLPLLVEDRLLGVLDLESYREDAFDADDETMMATLAANLAVALENARLVERLRREERQMSRELDAAREVQSALLPRHSPWLPGLRTAVAYCPARQLGGDLYDFLADGDDRFAVAVGDVAGKGTGAALYGSLAVGMLRGFAPERRRLPCCVLSQLNAELHQLRAERRFLALAFAVFDRRSNSLSIANSGLPYPLLVRGGMVREIELPGLPLGAMAGAEHDQVTVELEPGDAVVFITDGIDECRDPAGQPFGGERVRRTLEALAGGTARQLADGLLAATDRHLAGGEPEDDRTVVVLGVEP